MSSSLPANVENWNTDHVIQWGKQREVGLDEDELALLTKEKYTGISLRCATRDSLKSDGFAGGRADAFLFARDKLFPVAGEDDRKWTTEYAHTLPVRLQPASVDPKSEPGKLLGRSAACQEIMTVAVNNCTQRNTTDHAEFSFLVAAGHVRSGKTRMGIEAPRLVEHACKTNNNISGLKILKPVYLKMDFLNGCKFDISFDLDASPSVALGARLMYAFHGTPPDLELKGVSLKSITHHDAFRYIISRTLQSDKSGECIVPLVCHFDEHGGFTEHFGKAAKDESAGRTQFIDMLWLIGSTVTSTDSPLRADLQGRYFIVPITTGTSKKEANISGISNYGLNQLPLPSLSFEDSIELAQQFFVIAAPGAGARIDAELKKLPLRIAIADTGGLPGLVGMVARGGLLDSGEYTVRLHGNVAGYTHGLDWSARWSKLVSVCLARPTVNEESIIEKYLKRTPNGTVEELYKVSDARDSGTILFENNEIGLSVSLFRRFNTQANNRQSVNEVLLRDMTNSMTWGWEIFEQAHAHYLAAVMAALIETKDEFFGGSVTLGNLLRHANPAGNVYLQRTLQLPLSFDGVNVKKEVKQSIPRGTGKRKRHTVDLDTKQEVMLAADGTPIIDGHINLTLGNAGDATGDGAVTLFMQYKHKKLESKTQVKVSEMNAAVQLLESRLKTSKWQGGDWLFLWVSNRQVVVDMENTDHRLLWIGKDDLVKHAPLIGRRGLVLEETDRADED